jgi:hypothetical protein
MHHASVLNRLSRALALPHAEAYHTLKAMYETALVEWPIAAGVIGIASREAAWITPLLAGLEAYGRTEGF